MSHRDKKLVYHLTALGNLGGILQHGLLSRREIRQRNLGFSNVADTEILEGRAWHGLDAMVPFHFIPRSPFDYRVTHENRGVPFILIAVQRTLARAYGWKIIPRHPLTNGDIPTVLPWDEGIEAIDWSQMDRKPRPYETDRECKLTCMAEALSPVAVPLTSAVAIYTATANTQAHVRAIVASLPGLHVDLNPQMFPAGCP